MEPTNIANIQTHKLGKYNVQGQTYQLTMYDFENFQLIQATPTENEVSSPTQPSLSRALIHQVVTLDLITTRRMLYILEQNNFAEMILVGNEGEIMNG